VPQRRPASVEVQDGIPKVLHVSEDRSHGYVPICRSGREPGPHKEPHTAPGTHEVPQGLALDEVSFAPAKTASTQRTL
jgi:hypothetical protein